MDEISDRYLDNADLFSFEAPESLADEKVSELLITKYPTNRANQPKPKTC